MNESAARGDFLYYTVVDGPSPPDVSVQFRAVSSPRPAGHAAPSYQPEQRLQYLKKRRATVPSGIL